MGYAVHAINKPEWKIRAKLRDSHAESKAERLTALQSGKVDVLSRNTTWTMSREAALGLNFAAVNYYDGQGFMVPRSLNVTSSLELDGTSICVETPTTTELYVADYFHTNNMKYQSPDLRARTRLSRHTIVAVAMC